MCVCSINPMLFTLNFGRSNKRSQKKNKKLKNRILKNANNRIIRDMLSGLHGSTSRIKWINKYTTEHWIKYNMNVNEKKNKPMVINRKENQLCVLIQVGQGKVKKWKKVSGINNVTECKKRWWNYRKSSNSRKIT